MNLEQFNVDLEGNLKKQIRVEAVEMEFTHGVMITAIVADFYRRHRSKSARQKIFAAMKAKVDKGQPLEVPENNTIHHVELAEVSSRG